MEEYWPPVVTLASDIGSDCGITAALVPQFTAGAQWLDGLSIAYIPHSYLSSKESPDTVVTVLEGGLNKTKFKKSNCNDETPRMSSE